MVSQAKIPFLAPLKVFADWMRGNPSVWGQGAAFDTVATSTSCAESLAQLLTNILQVCMTVVGLRASILQVCIRVVSLRANISERA